MTLIGSCPAIKIGITQVSKKNEIIDFSFQTTKTPMNFTDSNWKYGVPKSIRAFFAANTLKN